MYLNSLFLVMQLFITVGVRNGLVQGLEIGPYPVPDQCVSTCTPASALYASCGSDTTVAQGASCLCSAGNEAEIQQCINCAIPIDPSLVSQLEPLLEGFNDVLCTNLPPLTFPPTTITSDNAPTVSTSTTTSVITPTVTISSTTSVIAPTFTTGVSSTSTVIAPTVASSTTSVIAPTATISSTISLPNSLPAASSGTTSTDTVISPATSQTPQITETTVPPSTPSQVIPSTPTTTVAPSASGTVTGSTTSAGVTPLSTSNVNGAELSVQPQLGSMGIAIGISLLLWLF